MVIELKNQCYLQTFHHALVMENKFIFNAWEMVMECSLIFFLSFIFKSGRYEGKQQELQNNLGKPQ